MKNRLDSLTEQSKWEDVKGKIEHDNDYLALSSDADRIRLFEDYHQQVVAEAQAAAAHHSHHHHKKARKEKKKRKHEKSTSSTAVASVCEKSFSSILELNALFLGFRR